MKGLGLAAVVAAVLSLAVGAGKAEAHAGAPWITAQRAANLVFAYDLDWGAEGVDVVDYVSCRGTGARIGSRFRHFNCYVEVDNDDPYWIRVHSVYGGFDFSFLGYD